MNSDYPRMLYRKGDSKSAEYHGLHCETCIVEDADEEAAITGEGWRRTPAEAHGKEPDMPAPQVNHADDGLAADLKAVTHQRDDLLQQLATEREARAAAEKERDESRELIAAFDRDNDGKPGGSKPKDKQKV